MAIQADIIGALSMLYAKNRIIVEERKLVSLARFDMDNNSKVVTKI